MRVIAGTARSVALAAPKGTATRPTTDRLKENLFNLLMPTLSGARFLDLYSGSGAIGIEALSRGASTATLVENAPKALEAIRANLKKTNLAEKAEILSMPVECAIGWLEKNNKLYDIIFMDPPYNKGYIPSTFHWLEKTGLLAENGILATEMPSAEENPLTGALVLLKEKIYGEIKFTLYKGGNMAHNIHTTCKDSTP